jgi:hypothetical protein
MPRSSQARIVVDVLVVADGLRLSVVAATPIPARGLIPADLCSRAAKHIVESQVAGHRGVDWASRVGMVALYLILGRSKRPGDSALTRHLAGGRRLSGRPSRYAALRPRLPIW